MDILYIPKDVWAVDKVSKKKNAANLLSNNLQRLIKKCYVNQINLRFDRIRLRTAAPSTGAPLH